MTWTFLGTLGVGGLAYVVLAVFAGAFVKGYSGFGASMMWVASLSLVMPPDRVVPMVLLWEVASSLQLLPRVWRKVEWRSLGWLSLGAGIATPLGVLLLASFSTGAIRVFIALWCWLVAFSSGAARTGSGNLAPLLPSPSAWRSACSMAALRSAARRSCFSTWPRRLAPRSGVPPSSYSSWRPMRWRQAHKRLQGCSALKCLRRLASSSRSCSGERGWRAPFHPDRS